jgi:hypothetical protein
MNLILDDEFRAICREIITEYDRKGDASLVESDDLYQTSCYCGGWQPEDRRFWFSFYAPDGGDYIFSFSLEDARMVASGGTIDPPLEYWKETPS